MFVQSFYVKGLAHISYLVAGSDTCAIVDPRRDVQIYIDAAKERGVKITHILETHLHADFVSGPLDLAEKTGAPIYIPKSGNAEFDHLPVAEGDEFEIEDMKFKVLETPGHTPEHVSYVVTDTSRGEEPAAVFCGDTLFVGDVGRPDLFPNMAEKLATKLYDSLHEKLMKLPDHCQVYPLHGAGSLCGRAMGAMRLSTIGYERKYNAPLQIKDRQEFIKSLTNNMPPAPDHFGRCTEINRAGPQPVHKTPKLESLSPKEFQKRSKAKDTIVLDIRRYSKFGGLHVAGAYHIDIGGNFATFAGWVLPPDKDILLVADNENLAHEAKVWMQRVGLDRVVGWLEGSMFEWSTAGLPSSHIPIISSQELHEKITRGDSFQLVDVRAESEYKQGHISGAINIPAPDLRTEYKKLDPEMPTVLICSTGHRSSLASSLLAQKGFKKLYNTAGGMTGYSAAGFEKECAVCTIPHGPQV